MPGGTQGSHKQVCLYFSHKENQWSPPLPLFMNISGWWSRPRAPALLWVRVAGAVVGAVPQATLLWEKRPPEHGERLRWAHRGAGRRVWTGGSPGRPPLPSPAQTEALPSVSAKPGWNPSRASLNKQSIENRELLNTSHISIDFHADARWSVAFRPPTGSSSKPCPSLGGLQRPTGTITWVMPTLPQ